MFWVVNGGSVNGPGSSLGFTKTIREQLPDLLGRYGVMTMLDAPCGDMTWMSKTALSLASYIGMDVDEQIIDDNRARHQGTFICANLLTRKRFPKVDVILCRDFLAHLTTEYIGVMVDKFRESGSTYLLASNYPGCSNEFHHEDFESPWLGYLERPHDLTVEPFNLKRLDGIEEQAAPGGVIANAHELALFELQGA
jgi:hypothetical protein